ncbi:hypothetical protein SAMN05216349_1519 [Oribacterium sp. KHPX15]|uniref:hypothetical protein n=1 Tax=Oribacterium sp. KHPX15 TaxID=1855342 RepID=UPI000894AEBA|nr:hypothetical protein [Oribacterium sp. KHPX15]SEA91096.1 hypothetical protein SAMN05216349_1519 [Oribacterium sp. KHPX15]
MSNNEKKVIAVIVEGPTDVEAIGSILKSYFSSDEVQFVVIHGDITTQEFVSAENIISKIDEQVHITMGQYSYHDDDMKQIFHILDTDGACIPDEDVHESEQGTTIKYFLDHIETPDVKYIRERNRRKSALLYKLSSTSKIHGIPYRAFYNSRNLEHALYGISEDLSDDKKSELADDFAEKYEEDLDGFIKLINSDEIAVKGTWKDTWKYIQKEHHSLERHSNMHLVF